MDPKKAQEEQQKQAKMEEARKEILSNILSPEAFERLARIKMVKPEKAVQLENYLIKMGQSGQFQEPVSENSLVTLLEKVSENKKETTVKIVRKKFDDDDDY